jgi:hypothetical protein
LRRKKRTIVPRERMRKNKRRNTEEGFVDQIEGDTDEDEEDMAG